MGHLLKGSQIWRSLVSENTFLVVWVNFNRQFQRRPCMRFRHVHQQPRAVLAKAQSHCGPCPQHFITCCYVLAIKPCCPTPSLEAKGCKCVWQVCCPKRLSIRRSHSHCNMLRGVFPHRQFTHLEARDATMPKTTQHGSKSWIAWSGIHQFLKNATIPRHVFLFLHVPFFKIMPN